MRIIFMGTPDYALEALKALFDRFGVVAVYCKAPKPKGRGMQMQKCETHLYAEERHIPVHTPRTLKVTEEQEQIRAYNPDIIVVAAYGLILPQEVLEIPRMGCVNIHGSLLPRWRGASPIHHALLAGDKITGITTMLMDIGVDTGDMLLKEELAIESNDNVESLYDKLKVIGARLIVETIENLDRIIPEKQDEALVTFAPKAHKTEMYIDRNMPVAININKIAAFYPAKYQHGDEILNIYNAEPGERKFTIQCSDGPLSVLKIQRPGKKILDIDDFMRGQKNR